VSTNHDVSPVAAPTAVGPLPAAGLARFRKPRQRRPMGEQCEMCAELIGEEHRHVANLESRSVLCTCTGCYLLFTSPGAAQGKYQAIPDRYRYDPSFALPDPQWDELQIPVRMAFVFFNSKLDRWVTFYPSPAGATESLLPLDTWREVLRNNPALADTAPDVEALLLRRGTSGFECYQVPIDACYQLAGIVKLHWKGFDGGAEAWDEINAFFARLRARSQVIGDE
jgi:hypothetical protein